MNELDKARKEINEIDAEMALLFEKRMKASECAVQKGTRTFRKGPRSGTTGH